MTSLATIPSAAAAEIPPGTVHHLTGRIRRMQPRSNPDGSRGHGPHGANVAQWIVLEDWPVPILTSPTAVYVGHGAELLPGSVISVLVRRRQSPFADGALEEVAFEPLTHWSPARGAEILRAIIREG